MQSERTVVKPAKAFATGLCRGAGVPLPPPMCSGGMEGFCSGFPSASPRDAAAAVGGAVLLPLDGPPRPPLAAAAAPELEGVVAAAGVGLPAS